MEKMRMLYGELETTELFCWLDQPPSYHCPRQTERTPIVIQLCLRSPKGLLEKYCYAFDITHYFSHVGFTNIVVCSTPLYGTFWCWDEVRSLNANCARTMENIVLFQGVEIALHCITVLLDKLKVIWWASKTVTKYSSFTRLMWNVMRTDTRDSCITHASHIMHFLKMPGGYLWNKYVKLKSESFVAQGFDTLNFFVDSKSSHIAILASWY